MNITVNNKKMTVGHNCSIHELLTILENPTEGVAVAINDTVIPRARWATESINENDDILIIKATRGG